MKNYLAMPLLICFIHSVYAQKKLEIPANKSIQSFIERLPEMQTNLNLADETNQCEFPLILINNQPATLADLNKYTNQDVANLEILNPDNALIALYGTRSACGVVKLETK